MTRRSSTIAQTWSSGRQMKAGAEKRVLEREVVVVENAYEILGEEGLEE